MSQQKAKLIPLIMLIPSIVGSTIFFSGEASAYREIIFPVLGPSSFSNDFYAPRGSRTHHAIDILAKKGQPLVSAVRGTVLRVQYPQPSWGYSITIMDDDGFRYTYIHMNDDNPGTNDGKGGGMHAYAPDMKEGNRVAAGQLIGWVGDSGNSNGVPHLHFEIRTPSGKIANPYESLVRAKRISKPNIPGRVTTEILPYGQFNKGANLAMGNFDLDVESEIVVAPLAGGGPHIKVYDHNWVQSASFFSYQSAFRGGVDVTTGDIDGVGTDEIITAAGPGGGPHIKVFETDGTLLASFFAYDSDFRYGVKIAAGDLTGDGRDEIITGLGPGSTPRVRAFDVSSNPNSPTLIRDFDAFSSRFRGGVDVASGDTSLLDLNDEIVVGAGPGGDPKVRVFDSNGSLLQEFFAYKDTVRGGVRVSVGNVRLFSAEEEIVTVPASKGGPQMKMFDTNGTLISSTMFIESWWRGGYDVAAGYDNAKGVTGPGRRVSIRPALD